jgi:hypothetical protein
MLAAQHGVGTRSQPTIKFLLTLRGSYGASTVLESIANTSCGFYNLHDQVQSIFIAHS